MKIMMTKLGMTRWCQDYEQELLESAGWARCDSIKKVEDVINLKPAVKTKGTVKLSLDDAISKGDE
jgi:hypothetical protein